MTDGGVRGSEAGRLFFTVILPPCVSTEPPAEDKQSQAIRELLEAIYPRKDRQEYVVKLDPIETNQNAVYQRLATEDEVSLHEDQDAAHRPASLPPDPKEQRDEDDVSEGEEDEPEKEEEPETAREREAGPGAEHEEGEGPAAPEEDEDETSEEEDYKVHCCLCGKDFNSHRSMRRHCRKMHKAKMEELCKFTETHTVPISLFSTVRGRLPRYMASTSCPMCSKSFATRANVRRHFDEVHRGLRRDVITPDMATKPGQPLSLDAALSPRKQKSLPQKQKQKQKPKQKQYNLVACKCLMCRRQYSSQVMLGRHLRIVHKINILENGSSSPAPAPGRHRDDDLSDASSPSASPSPPREAERRGPSATHRSRFKSAAPKIRKVVKLSLGFDFKMLYCKLCKRQFSSKQNLNKHIDMHTDGNDIYIKFYRCPICNYDSRRKRDVIRHITVVHKKSSRYLAKIIPNLEDRAIKKPAEFVLNSLVKKGPQKEEVNGKPEPQAGSSAVRKQDPPTASPVTRRQEALEAGTEVKVTKNFSLHACDICGKAFAKKIYLESHKRSHKTAAMATEDGRTKGRSTRSKAFIWYVHPLLI